MGVGLIEISMPQVPVPVQVQVHIREASIVEDVTYFPQPSYSRYASHRLIPKWHPILYAVPYFDQRPGLWSIVAHHIENRVQSGTLSN